MYLIIVTEEKMQSIKFWIEDRVYAWTNRRKFTGRVFKTFDAAYLEQPCVCGVSTKHRYAVKTKLSVDTIFAACSGHCAKAYVDMHWYELKELGSLYWTLSKIWKERIWKR
jgi:hypothetical protein